MSAIKQIFLDLYNDTSSLFQKTPVEKFVQQAAFSQTPIANPNFEVIETSQVPLAPAASRLLDEVSQGSFLTQGLPTYSDAKCNSQQSPQTQVAGDFQNYPGDYIVYAPYLKPTIQDYYNPDVIVDGTYTPQNISPSASRTYSTTTSLPVPVSYSLPGATPSSTNISTYSTVSSFTPTSAPAAVVPIIPMTPSSVSLAHLSPSSAGMQQQNLTQNQLQIVNGGSGTGGGTVGANSVSGSLSQSSINPLSSINLNAQINQNGPDYTTSMVLPDGRIMFLPGYDHNVGIFDPCTNDFDKISPRLLTTPDPYQEYSALSSPSAYISSSASSSAPSSAPSSQNTPIYVTFNLRFPAYTPNTFSSSMVNGIIQVYNTIFISAHINATVQFVTILSGSAILVLNVIFQDGNTSNATQFIQSLPSTPALFVNAYNDPNIKLDSVSGIIPGLPSASSYIFSSLGPSQDPLGATPSTGYTPYTSGGNSGGGNSGYAPAPSTGTSTASGGYAPAPSS